ncbi:MAG: glutamate--cysteine ligase, partial [Chroococcidiopsidaceae cyanobacterium CP_BM_RX_35]|nr:glutamate--cysteine ligase [Chroococcidiopsidaceae cyanobacterium CP_BM_RX_35]
MTVAHRRIGLEQEFFLVDEEGMPSDRADEFLHRCREVAAAEGCGPEYFAPEWVKGMIEINTPPAHTANELAREYLKNLKLALQVGRELNLRLYPLSSYPLHLTPAIRDKLNYHVQVRTVGYDRFLHAGKCTGTHLHLEVAPGTIDSRVGVSYDSSPEAREELLNIYNLATALDSALVALARACPFYEGQALGLAAHAVRYRGSSTFGWEGVY